VAAEGSTESILELVQQQLSVPTWWTSGTALVTGIAAATVLLHIATGSRYGFDRDELMALEDARHLAWGYVQYPPLTAFFGRIALALFGTSLVGFRFFAALVQALALLLTGLMAKEFGGNKWAQIVAALAGVPFCLGAGALMQYISFDYICWVFVAYAMVRLLKSGNPRWWLAVGAGIGLGMMAKYTMGFFALGVVAGVLFTPARKFLRSGWSWLGVLLSIAVFLPNFLWQWQHNFVSLDFLRFLHLRDVGAGQTDWFLPGQLEVTLLAFPLAVAGVCFCLFLPQEKSWRPLAWMYLVPLALLFALRGRDYYLAPAYPMLYAAGAVWLEQKLNAYAANRASLRPANPAVLPIVSRRPLDSPEKSQRAGRLIFAALILDIVIAAVLALPIAPVGSRWFELASRVDPVFPEEVGWRQFVKSIAQVRDALTPEERAHLGILAGNYGEVGALNLYGEELGLPHAISGVNSSWERGYGEPPPETVIVIGYSGEFLRQEFSSCYVAGETWNRFGVANEESSQVPDIFVCSGLKEPWPQFWLRARRFA